MQLRTIERFRGNCEPIEWEIENEDGTAFDPSGYTWYLSAKPEPAAGLRSKLETTESTTYSLGPVAGSWDSGAGLVRFTPTQAEWLKLVAGQAYRFEMIGLDSGDLPGPQEQFVMVVNGRAYVPPVVP